MFLVEWSDQSYLMNFAKPPWTTSYKIASEFHSLQCQNVRNPEDINLSPHILEHKIQIYNMLSLTAILSIKLFLEFDPKYGIRLWVEVNHLRLGNFVNPSFRQVTKGFIFASEGGVVIRSRFYGI